MPDGFTIEANIPEVLFSLRKLKAKQLPFATSLAINLTLKDAQVEVRKELPRKFNIRRPWVSRGVVVRPSKKDRLFGSIGQRDAFMVLQEFGGEKKPVRTAIAIPVGQLARLAKAKVLSRARRPPAQLRRKTVYRGETKKGVPAIIKRGTKSRRQEVLYLLVSSARVQRRFDFVPTVRRVVAKRWQRNMGRAIARAIKTAR